MPLKKCSKCKKNKSLSDFTKDKSRKDGLCNTCKLCRNIRQKKYYEINRSKRLKYEKNRYKNNRNKFWANNIKKYGITIEDWQAMFEAQLGCCLICGTHQSKLKKRLSIDHNHGTGKVRGLLCNNCNRALGLFGDSVNNIKGALDYLRMKDEI